MYNIKLSPVSNRADWIESFELINDDTGEIITDLDDVVMKIEVRDETHCRRLTGSTDDGTITEIASGVMQWHFTPQQMGSLCFGTYEVGLIITRDDITEQELIGTLPVVEGVVRS
jgi:hypothetical protein